LQPLNQLDELDPFLVICHEDRKLSYALEMTNGINVRYHNRCYSVSFKLSEASADSGRNSQQWLDRI